jgi:hypothetical protein
MFYVSLGVVMLGFDWSCYPQLLAMQTFAKKYGYWDEGTKLYIVPSGRQGAWNGASSGTILRFFIIQFLMPFRCPSCWRIHQRLRHGQNRPTLVSPCLAWGCLVLALYTQPLTGKSLLPVDVFKVCQAHLMSSRMPQMLI